MQIGLLFLGLSTYLCTKVIINDSTFLRKKIGKSIDLYLFGTVLNRSRGNDYKSRKPGLLAFKMYIFTICHFQKFVLFVSLEN